MAEQWILANVWNKALDNAPPRVYEPRDRIWASELYNSNVDIYLKMKGEQPTNLPNDRSIRKFEAGHMHEWFVKLILARIGIFKSTQDRVIFEEEGLVNVSGKIDFLAGGMPEHDTRVDEILGNMEIPELYQRQAEGMINFFKSEYPDGLDEKIIEIKSASLFAFNKVEATGKPLTGHDLQAYHYARNAKKEVALVYICRDDLRMFEISIPQYDDQLEERYYDRIREITYYHKNDIMPALEPLIEYDVDTGRFSKNFRVEYSPFLTKLYGFESPGEYDEKFAKMVTSWNGVMKRLLAQKKMTPLNEEKLREIESYGFDLDFIKNNLNEILAKGIDIPGSEDEEI